MRAERGTSNPLVTSVNIDSLIQLVNHLITIETYLHDSPDVRIYADEAKTLGDLDEILNSGDILVGHSIPKNSKPTLTSMLMDFKLALQQYKEKEQDKERALHPSNSEPLVVCATFHKIQKLKEYGILKRNYLSSITSLLDQDFNKKHPLICMLLYEINAGAKRPEETITLIKSFERLRTKKEKTDLLLQVLVQSNILASPQNDHISGHKKE